VFAEPIIPPRYAAGFDFWAGDARPLATQDAVLKAFPMLTTMHSWDPSLPDSDLSGSTTYTWEGKLDVSFRNDTHRVATASFGSGYPGKISFTSSPSSSFGQHDYTLAAGAAIQRDGTAWKIDWRDHGDQAGGVELCRAMTATFGEGPRDEAAPLSAEDCYWDTFEAASTATLYIRSLGVNVALNVDGRAPDVSAIYMHFDSGSL
jgi:hypothetical protein